MIVVRTDTSAANATRPLSDNRLQSDCFAADEPSGQVVEWLTIACDCLSAGERIGFARASQSGGQSPVGNAVHRRREGDVSQRARDTVRDVAQRFASSAASGVVPSGRACNRTGEPPVATGAFLDDRVGVVPLNRRADPRQSRCASTRQETAEATRSRRLAPRQMRIRSRKCRCSGISAC